MFRVSYLKLVKKHNATNARRTAERHRSARRERERERGKSAI